MLMLACSWSLGQAKYPEEWYTTSLEKVPQISWLGLVLHSSLLHSTHDWRPNSSSYPNILILLLHQHRSNHNTMLSPWLDLLECWPGTKTKCLAIVYKDLHYIKLLIVFTPIKHRHQPPSVAKPNLWYLFLSITLKPYNELYLYLTNNPRYIQIKLSWNTHQSVGTFSFSRSHIQTPVHKICYTNHGMHIIYS